MITIVIFASSLSLASILVLIKAIELKYKKRNIALRVLGKLDNTTEKLIFNFKFKSLQLIQSLRYILLVQSKAIFKEHLHKIQEKMLNEYKIRHEKMMGKRNISANGSASFYLKKITESKDSGEKGRIEEGSIEN